MLQLKGRMALLQSVLYSFGFVQLLVSLVAAHLKSVRRHLACPEQK